MVRKVLEPLAEDDGWRVCLRGLAPSKIKEEEEIMELQLVIGGRKKEQIERKEDAVSDF